jgi:hypothetical protein
MTKHDGRYYREMARAERERATSIVDPDTAAVHHELARGFEALASAGEDRLQLTASNSVHQRG